MASRQIIRLGQGGFVALSWLLALVACGDSSSTNGAGGGSSQCSESPCKLVVPQCGCGESQRCSVDGQGARYCLASGAAKPGEACDNGANDCAVGGVCVGLSTDVHVCASFCNTDTDCGSALCARHLSDGNGGTLSGILLCTDTCNPIAGGAGTTTCAQGTACALLQEPDGNKRWFTQCALPAGSGVEGTSCASAPCAPGFVCATSQAGSTCHALCDLGATSSTCTAPAKCVAFDTPVMAGTTQYGACQ